MQVTGVEANQERGLAWDMNSQVGAWIRCSATTNPLRGAISSVYGFGYSQTGGYLNTYTNAIHKLARSTAARRSTTATSSPSRAAASSG